MEGFEISWPLILFYLLLMLGIGLWAARTKVASMEDMAVAGRRSGVWLVTFSVAATWINGVSLISISGLGKDFGMGSYWSAGSFMAATIWLAYYMIPRLRQARVITIPQLFYRYFGSKSQVLSLLLVMLRDLGATAGVMGSLAVVGSKLLGLSIIKALLLTYVLMLMYLILGGMWAVLVTDAIQIVIVLFSAAWLLVLAFSRVGGMSAIAEKVPPEILDVVGPAGPGQVMGWVVIGFAVTLGYQSIIQRGLAAADHEVARRGFLYGGLIGFFWYMALPLLGIAGRAAYGGQVPSEEVFLRLLFDLGGPLASVLIITILAASMSTLDSTINTIASNFSFDIYSKYINPEASQRRQLWIYRLNILLVGLLAALLYYAVPLMLELFWIGGRVMGASLTPALVALVLFRRTRKAPKTVFFSMLLGASVVTLWQLFLGEAKEVGTMVVIWSLDPILVGLPLTILSLWVGVKVETRNLDSPS